MKDIIVRVREMKSKRHLCVRVHILHAQAGEDWPNRAIEIAIYCNRIA